MLRTDPHLEPRPRHRRPNSSGSRPSLPRAGSRVQAVLPAPPPTRCDHAATGARVPGGQEEERPCGFTAHPWSLGSSARGKGHPHLGASAADGCPAVTVQPRPLLASPRSEGPALALPGRRRQEEAPSSRGPGFLAGCSGRPVHVPGPPDGRAALCLLQVAPQVLSQVPFLPL